MHDDNQCWKTVQPPSFPSPEASTAETGAKELLDISESEPPPESHASALAPKSPKLGHHLRCTGTPRGTPGLVVLDRARALGFRRRGLQVPAGCAPQPGARGGAAGLLNLQGRSEGCSRDGATRGPFSIRRRRRRQWRRRRRRGAPGRCVLDPFLSLKRLVSWTQGLAGCGLQAPTQEGAGLNYPQELALHWGAVVACLSVCSRPNTGPRLSPLPPAFFGVAPPST